MIYFYLLVAIALEVIATSALKATEASPGFRRPRHADRLQAARSRRAGAL
jgi:multidrug transporter EmrE-like cation transporter